MRNPITATANYLSDKADAFRNKNDLALCYENPVLFELKWTGQHFRDLYRITREKGFGEALKYDTLVTQIRHEQRTEGAYSIAKDLNNYTK